MQKDAGELNRGSLRDVHESISPNDRLVVIKQSVYEVEDLE